MPWQPIVLLHLSDIHFAKPGLGDAYDLDADLRRSLEADAEICAKKIGVPDAVLISGDIAFAGKREQYIQASGWLDKKLCVAVKCDPSSVWSVAGNHDVDQDIIKAKPTFQDVREKFRTRPVKEVDRLWEFHLTEPEVFYAPIAEYNRFAGELGCDVTVAKPRWDTGDRFRLNDGSILRIFGLNSALISDNQDHIDSGKMVIGTHQCQLPTPAGVENLMVCHHPPDWMRDGDSAEETFNPRCRIQLFGHKHKHKLTKLNDSLLRVSAGAVHPSRKEDGWEPRYNWICIWVETSNGERRMHVKVFPRIWNKTDQAFDADWANTEKGNEFKHVQLKLNSLPPQTSVPDTVAPYSSKSLGESPSLIAETEKMKNQVSDNRGNPVRDPERALARRFFQLGYVQKVKLAAELSLLDEADDNLTDQERQRQHLRRAKEMNLLKQLWDRVEQLHNDGRYPVNPFT